MQLQTASNDLHEFSDRNMIGHEKFATIEQREILFTFKSFNYDGYLVRLLLLDFHHIFYARRKWASFFESRNIS